MGEIPKAKDVHQLQSFIIPDLTTVLNLLESKRNDKEGWEEKTWTCAESSSPGVAAWPVAHNASWEPEFWIVGEVEFT